MPAVILGLFLLGSTCEASKAKLVRKGVVDPAGDVVMMASDLEESDIVEFDCEVNEDSWHRGWSTSKKVFCCQATGSVGCEGFDCDEGLARSATDWSDPKKRWCCHIHGKGCTGSGVVASTPVSGLQAVQGHRATVDGLSRATGALKNSWKSLRRLSSATLQEYRSSLQTSGAGHIAVSREAARKFHQSSAFLDLSRLPKTPGAKMKDGTPADYKKLPVDVSFPLGGSSTVALLGTDVRDVWGLRTSQHRLKRLMRILVSIPALSLPKHGIALHTVVSEDGVRNSASLPVDAIEYWNEKANGYKTYGPSFLTKLKSFNVSSDDEMVIPYRNKTFHVPVPNLRQPVHADVERIAVRGKVTLDNMQRYRLTWPTISEKTTSLYESMEGWLEDISTAHQWLNLTLIVAYEEDRRELSVPLDKVHEEPGKPGQMHLHQHYGTLFQVDPLDGKKVEGIALRKGSKVFQLSAGAQLQTNFLVTWEAIGGALVVGDVAGDILVGAAADAAADGAASAAGDAAAEAAAEVAADEAGEVEAGEAGEVVAEDGADDGATDAADDTLEQTEKDDASNAKKAQAAGDPCPDSLTDVFEDLAKEFLLKSCLDESPCQKNDDGNLEICAIGGIPFAVTVGSDDGNETLMFVKSKCPCGSIPGFGWDVMPLNDAVTDALQEVCEDYYKLQDYIETVTKYEKLVSCGKSVTALRYSGPIYAGLKFVMDPAQDKFVEAASKVIDSVPTPTRRRRWW